MTNGEHGNSRTDRQIEFDLIRAAVLAPSPLNTQPWLFSVHDGGFDLLADLSRNLRINDPDHRELTISCGCALFNARVAAAHAGIDLSIALLPESNRPELLAKVKLLGKGSTPHELARLHSVLALRRTYRQAFAPVEVTPSMRHDLVYAAEYDSAWVRFLTHTEERDELAALVAEGDNMLWNNAAWREELAEWMRPRQSGDGLVPPGRGLTSGRHIIRRLKLGGKMASRDRRLIAESPLLAVIGTDGNENASSWLNAGMALQHVLLAAAFHGLQASYLNQPVRLACLRPRLQSLLATTGSPQIVLRLGMAFSSITRTARRPIQDVVKRDAEEPLVD